MKELTFEIPDEYPNVLLAVAILCLELIIVNYIMILPARLKHFNKDFMV